MYGLFKWIAKHKKVSVPQKPGTHPFPVSFLADKSTLFVRKAIQVRSSQIHEEMTCDNPLLPIYLKHFAQFLAYQSLLHDSHVTRDHNTYGTHEVRKSNKTP